MARIKVCCVKSDAGLNFHLNVRTTILVSCLDTFEALICCKPK